MSNELAIVKKNVIDVVAGKVRKFTEKGELNLPANYSSDNAIKAAWLILQNTVDRNKTPVLKSCTQSSIANALLDMVVQGLNPMKKQCYFIAYGKELVCQRSYHGARAVVMNVCGATDVDAQVVWGDDEFEYEIVNGVKKVTVHKQKLGNVGQDPQGAYCVISFPDGRVYTDIMTMADIKKAWSKSKMNPNKSGSTHHEFQEEMIRKTIINRACKKYINSSSDSALLKEHFNRDSEVIAEVEFEEEVEECANGEVIDTDTGEVAQIEEATSDAFEEETTRESFRHREPVQQNFEGLQQSAENVECGPAF